MRIFKAKAVRGWPVVIVCILMAGSGMLYGSTRVMVEERFVSLEHWQSLTFKDIEHHSTYTLVEEDGFPCLLMQSTGGASAMRMKGTFDVYAFPRLTWRWKVSNVYAGGDSSRRHGDDYPARLYIMFAYDPEQSSLLKQMEYETIKKIYGKYPPDSSLNYIWANKAKASEVIANAYTDRVMMIPVERGHDNTGTWQEYTVDMVADYQKAFKRNPPKTATLAVMIDSDDTGESARAWIDFIRISR